MNEELLQEIIAKTLTGDILSPEEKQMLHTWLSQDESRQRMFERLKDEQYLSQQLLELHNTDVAAAIKVFDERIAGTSRVVKLRSRYWYRYTAAAVVLLAAFTVYWLYLNKPLSHSAPSTIPMAKVQNDVLPGTKKATLILADGSKIVLDTATNGKLADQGATSVTNHEGQLLYDQNGATSETLYNILSTAKGQVYQTTLADGSRVWLNSGSSLKYPVAFSGNTRLVTVTGEAYFEVAHNAAMPFVVKMNDLEVQVLGTHFDANSYGDNNQAEVTLLKGVVKVSLDGKFKLLSPGQQAQVTHSGEIKLVKEANLDQVMAWKEGRFYFDHVNITTIAKQLERWYDIQVVFEGQAPTNTFTGEMQRNLNLSAVLDLLKKIGGHFRIDNNRLIITE
jgi:ferric-dicitrate binding protein FerR (iron transport regulator)